MLFTSPDVFPRAVSYTVEGSTAIISTTCPSIVGVTDLRVESLLIGPETLPLLLCTHPISQRFNPKSSE